MAPEPIIPVARPEIDEREVEAARRAILSGWVTQGPEVAAFEAEFAAAVGARHACAVSSGTAALHLALLALGVGAGDEVVTVSHSFIATANAIRYAGATPVLVDVEPATFNMDAKRVEVAVTERTRAILCVHQMGLPCDVGAIVEIARRRGLLVVEDAACAAGSEILWHGRWEPVGRPHGDVACFSFHPRKLLTTGDGGMVTTSSAEWDRRLRLLRWHGMSVPAHVRHAAAQVIAETYDTLGYNYRLTDIQGAIGREQLRRLPGMVARRRELAARYGELLRGMPWVTAPSEPGWARSNCQSYCVRLDESLDQRAVMQRMLDAGVATRRAVMCAHREMAYPPGTWSCGATGGCGCAAGACARLAESERAQDHAIVLPLFTQMTDGDQETVVRALRRACTG